MFTRITLQWQGKANEDINTQLQWLCQSIGLFTARDYDSSLYRLFIELIKDAKIVHYSTSDELAERIDLTRGTVIHHLNKLMDAGIVIRQKNYYILKEKDVKKLVVSMRSDINEFFDEIEKSAEKIDRLL